MTSAPRRRPPAPFLAGAASLTAFALLGLAVWLAHGPIGPDASIHRLLITSRDSSLDALAHVITFTGSAVFVYPMAAVVAAFLVALRRRIVALWFLIAVFGGALLCGVAKAVVERSRPDPSAMLGPAESAMSFPSGHTCMGALLFVGGAIVLTVQSERATRVLAVGAAMVWTALIAWSRLLLGYHWMTDLVGSVLLATSLLLPLAWLVQAPRPPYGDAGHVERAELVERAEHVEQAEHADSAPDPA